MTHKVQALFLSHGAGPMPLLGDPAHSAMVSCLKEIAAAIVTPDALLVVSAHWEEKTPTIMAARQPPLLYDYYGFPQESYSIEYPCKGDPALVSDVYRLLGEAGIEARLDHRRGFDHGMFVPLGIMYPQANIPCVQLSLVGTLDPLYHLAIGQALQPLSENNVLVIGSGFSFHNLKAFFAPDTSESRDLNHAFEQWLHQTCCSPDFSETQRAQRLVDWKDAPGARFCHPREEHLLPLHLCYGVAQRRCSQYFVIDIMKKKASMYLW